MEIKKEIQTWDVKYIPMFHSQYENEKDDIILNKTRPQKMSVACKNGEIHVFCDERDIKHLKKQEPLIKNAVAMRIGHLMMTENIDPELLELLSD